MVTISADLVPNLPAAARAMLEKAGLGSAENWIFDDGFVERLRFEIDPAWQGEIPRTILISRNGDITTIEGSAEMTDIRKMVRAAANRREITKDEFPARSTISASTTMKGRLCRHQV